MGTSLNTELQPNIGSDGRALRWVRLLPYLLKGRVIMWLQFWLAWGAIFVIGEGIALFNKTNGDTLSETVWAWLRGKTNGAKTRTIRATAGLAAVVTETPKRITWSHNTWRTWVVGSFLLWLFFHLTFGWFAG